MTTFRLTTGPERKATRKATQEAAARRNAEPGDTPWQLARAKRRARRHPVVQS